MIENVGYSTRLVQLLDSQVLPQIEAAIADSSGLEGMLWKAIAPNIPDYLRMLDSDMELQEKIIKGLRMFVVLLEDIKDPMASEKENTEGNQG